MKHAAAFMSQETTWETPQATISIEGEVAKRFWSKTVREGECVRWTASFMNSGYGQFNFRGSMRLAHRVSYILTYGEIPNGLIVRHFCDNRWCVNPQHLVIGTQKDNVDDALRRGRFARGERSRLRKYPETNPMYLYPDKACRGEKNGNAKLTLDEATEIRRLLSQGRTRSELGRMFSVDRKTIRLIAEGKTWQI